MLIQSGLNQSTYKSSNGVTRHSVPSRPNRPFDYLPSGGTYAASKIQEVLLRMSHEVNSAVAELNINCDTKSHISDNGTGKTITYKAVLGKKTFTIDFFLSYQTSTNNLKAIKKPEQSFRVRACTILSTVKSGVNVINKSEDLHIFPGLDLPESIDLSNIGPFILTFFNKVK